MTTTILVKTSKKSSPSPSKTPSPKSFSRTQALTIAAKDVSSLRSTQKSMKTLRTDPLAKKQQLSTLKQIITAEGMPDILLSRMSDNILRCMRNKRIPFNDPYSHGYVELELERQPKKCLLWKGLKYLNNTFKTIQIYIKGKLHCSSGKLDDAILVIIHKPYSNAPHAFSVSLHVANREKNDSRYSSVGKCVSYNMLDIDPRKTVTQSVGRTLASVVEIMEEACKPIQKRKSVVLHISRSMRASGKWGHIQNRPCTFDFTPDESAQW